MINIGVTGILVIKGIKIVKGLSNISNVEK
jgi:hypothetical protein